MRKKTPARAPEETRNRLVEAAGRLFNSVGYFGTDSNRIAREAGYAPGTFYVHFPDKREIFLEVYRGWVATEWQAIAAAIAPEKTGAARSLEHVPEKWKPAFRKGHASAQSLRIAQAVLRHHREWRMFRASPRARSRKLPRFSRPAASARRRRAFMPVSC